MIVCFSGTGNTLHVAEQLRDSLGDEIVCLASELVRDPSGVTLAPSDGRMIWAFPIHCWRMPRIVRKVIRMASVKSDAPVEHFMVATCGDDIGMAAEQWRRDIERRGWNPRSAFSVQMPNNYVFMKGFDVDPKDVAEAKIAASKARTEAIAEKIRTGSDVVTDVVRGSWPRVKTYVIYPWFAWRKLRIEPFHTTDACSGCGQCMRNCPLQAISMGRDHRPVWSEQCAMCLRCYHQCPNRAVAFGSATNGKGQYVCPGFPMKK